MQFHRSPLHVAFVKTGGLAFKQFTDPRARPERFLDIPRRDISTCAREVEGVAAQLGATASISEQNERSEGAPRGLSLGAEQAVCGELALVLSACPQVAKVAGLSAAELRATASASKETVLLGEQAGHLRRGAREASFVLGQSLVAVLDLARDGLVTLVNQGGAADQVASARADHDRLDAPLRAAAEQQAALSQEGRRAGAAQGEVVTQAKDQARFDTIVAALRERGEAAVSPADILWAGAFAEAHPPAAPEPAKASNRRAKGR